MGEGVAEGEVLKWLVKEGDSIKEDQPLVEVMTEKVSVEIPSPVTGRVLQLLVKEGEVVSVGRTLAVLSPAGDSPPTPKVPQASEAPPASAPPRMPPAPAARAPVTLPGQVLATPAVRKLARDLGVDPTQISGTGPGGRILEDDVRRAAPRALQAAVLTAPTPPGREERVLLRGLRRKTAERMLRAVTTAAMVTHVDEADVTALVALREQSKAEADRHGVRLTYLPFIIKALIPALQEFPYLNASLNDGSSEIVLKRYYNIGVAVDTEDGLVVPVVKEADRKSLLDLAQEVEGLAERARKGQLTLADVQGSTFTITSVGALRGLFATPILNPPEVAILGVHRISRRPVVRQDQVVARDMLYLSLTFDHRVLDGVMAARFMGRLVEGLEDPKRLGPLFG